MTLLIDELSPRGLGADMITITVANAAPILTSDIIQLQFDYSETTPSGVVLPLLLQVQPTFGKGAEYMEKYFRSFRPTSYAFQLASAGRYLVVIRETGHNFWQGRLLIDVAGEENSSVRERV